MSIEAVGVVLTSTLDLGGVRKLVLLGLANHAGPQGDHAYPSVETLATYAEVDRRTVQRALRDLVGHGLVEIVTEARGTRPREYRIDLERVRDRGDTVTPLESATATGRGDTRGTAGVTPEALRGDIAAPPEPSEPSVNLDPPSLRSGAPAAADAAVVEIVDKRPDQLMFEAICVEFGYDWREGLTPDARGAVNRQSRQLLAAYLDPHEVADYVTWLRTDPASPLVAGRTLTVSSLAKWLPNYRSQVDLQVTAGLNDEDAEATRIAERMRSRRDPEQLQREFAERTGLDPAPSRIGDWPVLDREGTS